MIPHRFFVYVGCLFFVTCQMVREEPVSFNRDIRPIFNEKCLRCHGGVKANGDFSLLFEEDAFAKTLSGMPAIIPGNHRKSELFRRIVHSDPELRMPFERTSLSQDEIDLIARWIDQGAQWEKHWAYIPPFQNAELPPVPANNSTRNDLDRFVIPRLSRMDLSPAPEADRATLLRRVFLDLIGLPPTRSEIGAFLDDNHPEAYERLVDRLLNSPHFGERWATMWLDLARYADTKGYEKDQNRQIWKYRDYVIDALNADKPFDEFTIEQLAGDLLSNPSEEQLIATAFHRNSISNDEGGTDDEEFRIASVIERVSTTYEIWQSTTMACVQCHGHPYDPFRQEDFYRSMAYFNNTEDRDNYNENPKLYSYTPENEERVLAIVDWLYEKLPTNDLPARSGSPFVQKNAIFEKLKYRYTEAEDFITSSPFIEIIWPEMDMLWQIQDSSWIKFDQVDLSAVEKISFLAATQLSFAGSVSVHVDSLNGRKIGDVRISKTGEWDGWQGRKPSNKNLLKLFTTAITPVDGRHNVYFRFWVGDTYIQHLFYLDKIFYHEKNAPYTKYHREVANKLASLAEIPVTSTPIIRELPEEKSRKTAVFDRGSWLTPTHEVTATIPAIFKTEEKRTTADRLEFAQWLVDKENPLTSRVMVNRIWEQIFGRGLVETMEEFGTQGEMPTHPELLDWLSLKLMHEFQWHLKPLIREMVTSATYRQSSVLDSIKLEKDPDNRWLSRGARVRLSSEQIRDQILTVSGLLNRDIGGPSVIIPELKFPEAFVPSWALVDEKNHYRRSLYVFWKRTDPFANLMTFDSPDRTTCTSRRIRTNTPLQALNLLNDQTYLKASFAMAQRMMTENTLFEKINHGYQLISCRSISEDKFALLKKLYEDSLEKYRQTKSLPDVIRESDEKIEMKYELAALTIVANALLNLDEFIVKD